ncbi:MAG: WYL domain-containing protein [Bacteroidales bacterium]|nr:WYL domain-containing protein [Bacteroidales bacterium]
MSSVQIQRLQWLIEVISDFGPITLKEIQDKWDYCSLNYDNKPYPRRTFYDHLGAIYDSYGISIKCNNDYEYYIDKGESTPTTDWMVDSFSINNTLQEAKALKNRIVLEDVPSGRKWLTLILRAMMNNNCLEVTHQSFKKDNATTRIMQPYFIQSHNRRWYLYAFDEKDKKMYTLALDRMSNVEMLSKTFKLPKDYEPKAHLAKGYGASIYEEVKQERIQVKTTAYAANFMRTLPLHDSQREIEKNDEYSIFEFYLPPVNEFLYDILHRGESVEILSPASLRKKLAGKVSELANVYAKKK